MENAIVPREANEMQPITMALSVDEMEAHVNLIQNVMQRVMKRDQHYGVVPGCGDKPALLKPGAEKILEVFRLSADPIAEDISSSSDEVRYRVKVRIVHQVTGAFIGAGIGECSSNEEKYKWRAAVNEAEFNSFPDNMRRRKWKKGYNGKSDYQINQVRTNPADVANTILKMAKKRGLVDGALTATAASDIFAQDIDEMEVDAPQSTPKPAYREAPRAAAPAPVQGTIGDPLSEVKTRLAEMNKGDENEMEQHLRTITFYVKDGKESSVGLKDLESILRNRPKWFAVIRAKISEAYQAYQANK